MLYRIGKKATLIPDIDDFKMPYKVYGTMDLQFMQDRYMKLQKVTVGNKQRLGFFKRSL